MNTSALRQMLILIMLLLTTTGCGVGAIVDNQRIQGDWYREDGSKAMSFHSDGTCSLYLPLATRQGSYEILSDNRLKITSPGALWGTNEEIVTYRFNGAKLRITTQILGQEVSGELSRGT